MQKKEIEKLKAVREKVAEYVKDETLVPIIAEVYAGLALSTISSIYASVGVDPYSFLPDVLDGINDKFWDFRSREAEIAGKDSEIENGNGETEAGRWAEENESRLFGQFLASTDIRKIIVSELNYRYAKYDST